ncbi:GNAT family N-acetyltransferase [Brevibacillus sp. NRS-1366]|uniref:GNAT family N-acetyltransferase n=1 Tax=Brevibacillus sp. NRS-1366 TaxID=3233899 RepID=UPI003D2064F9
MSVECRVLTHMDEMKAANQLIQEVWGSSNGISPYLLLANSQVGGLVLGGFVEDKLIGISYGFPCMDGTDILLYSHLLAVDPDYRGLKVGTMLKAFQANMARERGFTAIRWTFDPLESRNAHLNICKLGATSQIYKVNFYGEMADLLNAGSPTDRLLVEWDLRESRIEPGLQELEAYQQVASVEWDHQEQVPVCKGWLQQQGDFVKIPIPTDTQWLKEKSPEVLLSWRLQVRDMLLHYFQQQYRIQGFHYASESPVQYYLLHQNTESTC